uniref:Sulfur globule protein CV3 n=1 Tax=Candidatus Kentrum sp. MB TaxID=2138164 RepID=A0A450XCV5_9GAMM|nr:MAG: hypothetical protein BECKMB1821G_GA0114241_100910 [Candidatus Kentron sp. MB]VFK27111.1 MAG: hypothetical protein BECKMB1821I_GA0114274_100242 [Candidatus Kentron sp. MB]VFK74903.1 MAG: hypothetical protein BECKMB1821H_GA0114242_101211 [Candidatus Kentron sp. MB]
MKRLVKLATVITLAGMMMMIPLQSTHAFWGGGYWDDGYGWGSYGRGWNRWGGGPWGYGYGGYGGYYGYPGSWGGYGYGYGYPGWGGYYGGPWGYYPHAGVPLVPAPTAPAKAAADSGGKSE